jgi:hypothetical protein
MTELYPPRTTGTHSEIQRSSFSIFLRRKCSHPNSKTLIHSSTEWSNFTLHGLPELHSGIQPARHVQSSSVNIPPSKISRPPKFLNPCHANTATRIQNLRSFLYKITDPLRTRTTRSILLLFNIHFSIISGLLELLNPPNTNETRAEILCVWVYAKMWNGMGLDWEDVRRVWRYGDYRVWRKSIIWLGGMRFGRVCLKRLDYFERMFWG